MKIKIITAFIAAISLFTFQSRAQIYDTNSDVVQTFAGFGIPGLVNGQGQLTAFSAPNQIVADTASNLYVWDSANQVIRKITPDATVSTFAGGGTFFEGYGTNVPLSWGAAGTMVRDHMNTIWLVMANQYSGGYFLLTIATNGYVSLQNGGLTNLSTSSGLCFDAAGNLYYSGGNRIYRYNPQSGTVQAFAGSGLSGYYDGSGTLFSAFSNPTALASDQADNIYVWDSGNGRVRRVDPLQNVTTLSGMGYYYYYPIADGNGPHALFGHVSSMFSDHAGNIYFMCGTCVRKMDAQTNVVTLAGNFSENNYVNGPGNLARFNTANGGCFSQGMIFVADSGNNRIRDLAFNPQSQVTPPASLQLNTYPGLQISGTIGRTYQIQTSPDLNNWTTTATLLLTSSPYDWLDQNPVSGNKYYRALLLP